MPLDGWNDVHNALLISSSIIRTCADTYFTLTIDILQHSNAADLSTAANCLKILKNI